MIRRTVGGREQTQTLWAIFKSQLLEPPEVQTFVCFHSENTSDTSQFRLSTCRSGDTGLGTRIAHGWLLAAHSRWLWTPTWAIMAQRRDPMAGLDTKNIQTRQDLTASQIPCFNCKTSMTNITMVNLNFFWDYWVDKFTIHTWALMDIPHIPHTLSPQTQGTSLQQSLGRRQCTEFRIGCWIQPPPFQNLRLGSAIKDKSHSLTNKISVRHNHHSLTKYLLVTNSQIM